MDQSAPQSRTNGRGVGTLIRRPIAALREFLRLEAASGLVLMAATIVALIWANSPYAASYRALFAAELGLDVLHLSVLHWIDDALMSVFFLLVGLEIKRALMVGELSSPRRAALPAVAAAGGMALPALIYAAVNFGHPETMRGWAIPAATDIAFALGVLSLLGRRIPTSLKAFLAALAILDDLGAIAIIAVFYSAALSLPALALSGAGIIVLTLLNRLGVVRVAPYLAVGGLLWASVFASGVHPTLAGVVTAFAVPARTADAGETTPVHRLEHMLHPWVAFGIVPLFAIANAGVSFTGVEPRLLLDPVPLGIALGLFSGKQLGVAGAAWLGIRLRLAEPPAGAGAMQLYGVAILCGIGFTMSLFIGNLAFASGLFVTETKIGVFTGSLLSGTVGYALLRIVSKTERPTEEP